MTDNANTTREAALKLLRAGLASQSEVATLAGVSRQAVSLWCASAKLDWRKARADALARAWRKAMKAL